MQQHLGYYVSYLPFAEEYPAGLPDILLILCQITFVLALLLGIATVILLIMVLINKRTRREDGIFLLVGYVIMLISFAVFVIIYPYTCSSDFRYVAICLVYIPLLWDWAISTTSHPPSGRKRTREPK